MKRMSFAVFSVVLFLAYASPSILAQGTYTAASCSYSDVNAIIHGPTHSAVDGDTINIPPGTCSWSSQLVVNVGISIIGAGSGSTVIQDGYTGTLFSVTIPSATSSTFRLSGMTIAPSATSTALPALININGTCNASTCSKIRLDNLNLPGWNRDTYFSQGFVMTTDNVFGVLDHLSVTGLKGELVSMGHSAYGGLGAHGDNSWAQADSFGTGNALYIEDNTMTSSGPTEMATVTDTDHGGGARFVVRFNTFTNIQLQTHGTESSGRRRDSRQMEVYNNTSTCLSGANCITLTGLRGGALLTFNNTLINSGGNLQAEVTPSIYRRIAGFSTWGFCNGEGPYDLNDTTSGSCGAGCFAQGTISSPTSSVFTDAPNPGWITDHWVGYSVIDESRTDSHGNNQHPGYEITANTSNQITFNYYNGWGDIGFTNGDTYKIKRALACIDQPGRGGPSTYISGTSPSPAGWTNEPRDPIYQWGSTVSGATLNWVAPNPVTSVIQNNRDYYYQAATFNGTSGTGTGTLASRPSTCTAGPGGNTPGVAYWATDQGNWNQSGNGGQGQLYVCTATNTWSLYYTPYTYPHPLTGTAPAPPNPVTKTAPPTNLQAVTQ